MILVEFDPERPGETARIPRDPAERVAYECWSMAMNDDRAWANHLRRLARSQGNDGRRIDCYAYRPQSWNEIIGRP